MRAPSLDANRPPPATAVVSGVRALAIAAALASAACPAARPTGPSERPRVRVRSFTEAAPVRHILAVPPFAFAATSTGLDRWDLRSGQALHLGAEHGLPGERVQALDYDARGEVWIATDAGMVRYRVQEDAFQEVPAPPDILGVDSFEGATVSATPTGAWVGLRRGLFHVTRDGVWTATAITAPVTDLHDEPGGDLLWIGTEVGLFISRDGVTGWLGPDQGCDLAAVRFVARGPDREAVVVGESREGEQRIALAA
ncbi:MAG TPA: hypothetical protein VEL05_01385, partial [Candidatus Acidoferrum sp.]|nr:hypothetical protein [Candidatus Acidoferrum sp.]